MFYVIVWYFVHIVPLMCFGTLVAVMDVTTTEDMAALSHLGGCNRCHSGRGLGLFQ